MQEKVLLHETGELTPGKTAKFLGRVLHHAGTAIFMRCTDGYIQTMLEQLGLQKSNPIGPTRSKPPGNILPMDYIVSIADHLAALYRRVTGMLMWMIPI